MNPLTLNDLSGNAFRILGLTADASQVQIDAAARRMRISQDASMIPGTACDAGWIGPIPRTRQEIENAVARLTDPVSRVEERLWWFCQTPPASESPPDCNPADVLALHDGALVQLYHRLLCGISYEDLHGWQSVIDQFRILAASDDYLQWLIEVESAGDFEKRASLEEIAGALQGLTLRLSTAVNPAMTEALARGDFSAAAQAVQLLRPESGPAAAGNAAEKLLDRMEDDLAGRCALLVEKIDAAWKTLRVAELRPACNHAVARFGTVIQPLIDQLLSSATDAQRRERVRTQGVRLLIHISKGYEAIENYLAAERTLDTALKLAAKTSVEPAVINLQEKVKEAAQRQRRGAPRGQRQPASDKPAFKVMPGTYRKEDSWLSAISGRWIWGFIAIALGFARVACHMSESSSSNTSAPIPIYDSNHPPPFGR